MQVSSKFGIGRESVGCGLWAMGCALWAVSCGCGCGIWAVDAPCEEGSAAPREEGSRVGCGSHHYSVPVFSIHTLLGGQACKRLETSGSTVCLTHTLGHSYEFHLCETEQSNVMGGVRADCHATQSEQPASSSLLFSSHGSPWRNICRGLLFMQYASPLKPVEALQG